MKRLMLLVLLIAFFVVSSGISFAEEASEAKGEMKHHGMMKKGGMKDMHSMMMEKMMHREMVATKDGGVIVLTGNRLMKYDKDLNLVKEVEIKMDMEGMMKKMKECMDIMEKSCMEMKEGGKE